MNVMAEDPSAMSGVPTGFYDLDRMTAGLQPGDLIVLASRPSMGKSALALNIAEHVALNEGLPVAVFSMELSDSQLTTRIIASHGRIDANHIKTSKLTDEELSRLMETIESMRVASIAIDDTPNQNRVDLRAKALRQKELFGAFGLIVVDSLQMMEGDANANVHGLKSLARELACPIILTAHIGDSVEFRTDKRPTMYDIRDVPAIELIADTIMFLYRDEFYTKDACREPGVAELHVIKQRTGPTGVAKLAFLRSITKFETLAPPGSGDF